MIAAGVAKNTPNYRKPNRVSNPQTKKSRYFMEKSSWNSHPGLATSEQDSSRRRKFFHDGTKAFVNRDEVTLQALVNTFPRSNLPAVIDEAAIKNIEKQANAYEDLLRIRKPAFRD